MNRRELMKIAAGVALTTALPIVAAEISQPSKVEPKTVTLTWTVTRLDGQVENTEDIILTMPEYNKLLKVIKDTATLNLNTEYDCVVHNMNRWKYEAVKVTFNDSKKIWEIVDKTSILLNIT